MGAAGVKLYSTTSAIVDRVADGRFVFGYNILGSYAAEAAARNPDLGIILPADYTIVTSRIGLVPKASANPDLGRRYLAFFMSAEGQTIMAQQLQIAELNTLQRNWEDDEGGRRLRRGRRQLIENGLSLCFTVSNIFFSILSCTTFIPRLKL
jgi:ABC-type Fe3+ transport system substrate-binding protein